MNYVATSAFMLALFELRRHPAFVSRRRWLCAVFAFVAGMMHESASIAVVAGAVACLCMSYKSLNLKIIYKSLSKTDRFLTKSFALGATVAVFSPGIWKRFFMVQAGQRQFYDGSMLSLVLSTLPLLLLLLAVVLVMAVSGRSRVVLRRLFSDSCFVFCGVAAVVASVFVFASRLDGNSGWFAELFSLCALARMAVVCHRGAYGRWAVGATVVMAALVAAHSFYVAAVQKRYFDCIAEIRALYAATDDEVVFYDLPAPFSSDPLLIDRVHDVDNIDFYTASVVAKYYGRENMVVLPAAYRDADLDRLLAAAPDSLLKVNDEISLAAALPPAAEPFTYWTGARGWAYLDPQGGDITIKPFKLIGKEHYALIRND